MNLFWEAILSSTALVSASEMGDKTQLLAFALAAKFKKPVPIMFGILVATLLNHALAASVGSWVANQIPPQTLAMVLGGLFIAFGLWTLKPDTLDETSFADKGGVFLTTAILFFLAEMGDKTQFATMALGAEFNAPIAVTLGTTMGMMVSDGLAVFLGDRLAGKVQMKWVRWFAASLFFIFGLASLYSGLVPSSN